MFVDPYKQACKEGFIFRKELRWQFTGCLQDDAFYYTVLIEVCLNIEVFICLVKNPILHRMGFKNLHHICHFLALIYKVSFGELLRLIISNSRISSLNSLTILATRTSPCPAVNHGTTDSTGASWERNQTTKRHESRHRKKWKKPQMSREKLLGETNVLVILKDIFIYSRLYKHQFVSLRNKLQWSWGEVSKRSITLNLSKV